MRVLSQQVLGPEGTRPFLLSETNETHTPHGPACRGMHRLYIEYTRGLESSLQASKRSPNNNNNYLLGSPTPQNDVLVDN